MYMPNWSRISWLVGLGKGQDGAHLEDFEIGAAHGCDVV